MKILNWQLNFKWDLDKILLTLALIYLGCVLFWLFRKDEGQLPVTAQTNPDEATTTTPSAPANPEFIGYLQQSLQQIEQRQTASPPPVPLPVTTPAPPPPASTTPQGPPTVVERIYVPVYPSNQPPIPAANSRPANSRPATSPQAVLPPPPPVTAPPSVPVLTPGQQVLPLNSGNTLVGLLESGDSGYALFNINGTTQRFEPGEPIGGSGWFLAGVRNQTAIISRNGQQRMVEVGQRF